MKSFARTLKVMIVINVLIGLLFLIWPEALTESSAGYIGYETTWARGLGLMLILFSFALVPAAILPLTNRYLALLAAFTQSLLGIYFLCAGPNLRWLLVIYAFVVAYLLLATFWRGFRDDLMARP